MVGLSVVRSSAPDQARQLLTYWFGRSTANWLEPAILERWRSLGVLHVPGWRSDPESDHALLARFEPLLAQADLSLRHAWTKTPTGRLAYIVLCDQLPRAAYRGTRRAYEQDPWAIAAAGEGLSRGDDAGLSPIERAFFYMPLTHAEDLAAQDEACERFAALGSGASELRPVLRVFQESANRHRRIIQSFGRFPNRNAVLGRASTPEEQRYLASPWTYFTTDYAS